MRLRNAGSRTIDFAQWLPHVGTSSNPLIEVPEYISRMDDVQQFIQNIFPSAELAAALDNPNHSAFLEP